MTKLEGNLTPNVRFNAKGDNSLLVVRWGSDAVAEPKLRYAVAVLVSA